MRKRFFIMMGLGAMLLMSCDQDITNEIYLGGGSETTGTASKGELVITGTLDGMEHDATAATRAIGSSWETGDAIGVLSDGMMDNKKYTTIGDGSFTPASGKDYFMDADIHHFTAYYPYDADMVDGECGFTVDFMANADHQKATDFLFAEGDASASSPTLALTFKHRMARIIVNVKTSTDDGFMADDIFGTAAGSVIKSSTAQFGGLVVTGTFNGNTGVVTPSTDKAIFTVEGGVDDKTAHTRQYLLIVPEQQACSYRHIFNKGMDDEHSFTATLGTYTWKGGYSYTYNITVKRSGLSITSTSIEDWDNGGSHDNTANPD